MNAIITIAIICTLALPVCALIAIAERINFEASPLYWRLRAFLVGDDSSDNP